VGEAVHPDRHGSLPLALLLVLLLRLMGLLGLVVVVLLLLGALGLALVGLLSLGSYSTLARASQLPLV
jgi:hypothetical protein